MAEIEGNTHTEPGPAKPFFSGGSEEVTACYRGGAIGPGTQIGPFRLLGILGEGGYGIVYLAAQEQPIRRRVALKVIKPGMDSRQVIARFEAERQALALLDHPNMAHVHDAGTTPDGRPYFAMEYIEGLPITEYCDRAELSIKERLQIFLQVCEAVRHAHQKGIIHRDLKPSNMLVTDQNDKPLVKVIDFGIAKALAQPLTDRTLYTEQGQFIGTPDYMSPEQAEMDARGVDTRSDVYSLGVVLYELLTGVLPFDPDTLRAGGVDHIRAVIRDEEPRTPSTRLTGQGEKLTKIAQRRRTDPQTLTKSLRRELEWIPLQAIRKEPARRYQSVSELAEDLENYLRGAPLLAGPESVAYRTKKFVQRHAAAVGAVAIVIASLLIGLTVSTAMYLRAEKMRAIADGSRQTAETAQASEAAQRRATEQERDRALRAEEEATRRLVDLYQEQGRRYMELGDLDRALVLLTEALERDHSRASTLLLAQECLRTHPDPNLSTFTSLVPWKGELLGPDLSFAVSPDRRLIGFVNEGEPVVRVFDTETAVFRIQLPTGRVSRLAFVPGNQYLLVQAEESPSHHSICVYDLHTGKKVTAIRRANADINKLLAYRPGPSPSRAIIEKYYTRVLLSHDGQWFAFLSLDDSGSDLQSWASLWDFSENTLYSTERHGPETMLLGLAYRPSDGYGYSPKVFAVDCHSCVWLWNLPRLELATRFSFDAVDGIMSGTRSIGVNHSGTLYLRDRQTNRQIRTFPRILAYGWNPDASRLVTQTMSASPLGRAGTGEGLSVDLWDTGDGRHLAHLSDEALGNWHFSPDGALLITERPDSEIRVWLSQNGSPVFTIPGGANQEVADISRDGHWLVTDERRTRGLIDVWDLTTGQRSRPYAVDPACKDIGSGWALQEQDCVFSCSLNVPKLLMLWNANGSALICRSGLLPVAAGPAQVERIIGLVACHVPFRLQDGRIRGTSEKEMTLGAVDSYAHLDASRKRKAVSGLLGLISQALDQNDLTEADRYMDQYLVLPAIEDAEIDGLVGGLNHRLAAAYQEFGEREKRCGRYEAAASHYRRALHFRPNHPQTLSRLAWVLVASPNKDVRDPCEALVLSQRACDLTGWTSWEHLSVYATACAANGAFPEAVQWQKRAIQVLPPSEENRWGENLRLRLQLFESHRPYDRRQFYHMPGDNLLGWWTFESLDAGAFPDRSGRGHVAQMRGDVRQLTADDRMVLQFDGAQASVQCPNTPDLDVRDALTIIAWVKYLPPERPDAEYLQVIGKGHAWTLSVAPETHRLFFECQGLQVPATAPFSRVIGQTALNDGRWHQIAAVYDSRTLAVYLDGRLDGTQEACGLLLVDAMGIALGWSKAYETSWRGLMREVRIYDCAFSHEEVAELYDATK